METSYQAEAPPGPLGIIFRENTAHMPDGVKISKLDVDSPLFGQVEIGSKLVSVNERDCTEMSIVDVMALIAKDAGEQRRFVHP